MRLSGLGCRLIASPFRAGYCDGLGKRQAVCLHHMHVPCRESSNLPTRAARPPKSCCLDRDRPTQSSSSKHLFTPPVSIHYMYITVHHAMPSICTASQHLHLIHLHHFKWDKDGKDGRRTAKLSLAPRHGFSETRRR